MSEHLVEVDEPVCRADRVEQWRSRRRVNWRKILVPVDFTTSTWDALEYARALSLSFGSVVCLLHVLERAGVMSGTEAVPLWKSEQDAASEARSGLEQLAQQYLGASVPAELWVVSGSAGPEILRVARETACGLVILTTRGLGGWKHFFRRSAAKKVARDSPCPVLLLHCAKPLALEMEPENKAVEQADRESVQCSTA